MNFRDNPMRKQDSSSKGLRVIAKFREWWGVKTELWINLETSKDKARTNKELLWRRV